MLTVSVAGVVPLFGVTCSHGAPVVLADARKFFPVAEFNASVWLADGALSCVWNAISAGFAVIDETLEVPTLMVTGTATVVVPVVTLMLPE